MDDDIQGALEQAHTKRIRTAAAVVRKIWRALPEGKFPYAQEYMRAYFIPNAYEDVIGTPEDLRTHTLYVLCNLQYWRGEAARNLKAELKAAVGIE